MGGKENGSCRRVQAKIAVSTAQITQLVKMQERAYTRSATRGSGCVTAGIVVIIVILLSAHVNGEIATIGCYYEFVKQKL